MSARVVQIVHLLDHLLAERIWNEDARMTGGNVNLEDLLVRENAVDDT